MKMDDERHKEEFAEIRMYCPWVLQGQLWICKANNDPCEQNNCAIFYFKNFFEKRRTK